MRLTPHHFSPSVQGKILRASAREPSFQEAADALKDLAEVTISSRQLTRIVEAVGQELASRRDQQVQQLQDRQLTPTVTTRPALAVVEVDGGRLQIRGEGEGPGAHQAAWREDKMALLATAARTTFDADPEPDLPTCFRDQPYVEKVVREIGGVSSLGVVDPPPEPRTAEAPPPAEPGTTEPPSPHVAATTEPPAPIPQAPDSAPRPPVTAATTESPRRAPEFLVRTYVASTCDSEQFGPMVAAEAQRRNFSAAASGAFVGDGAAWIWTLHRRYFPKFEAIVDFLHVLSYLFAAAKAVVSEPAARWTQFQAWAEACWQGQVAEVLDQLRGFQESWGLVSAAALAALPEDDPRKVLAQSVGYLENNAARMDYPRYRREGLPVTSSPMESTVKRFNRRVKGTEKSGGESGAEAILQLRAAFLSEDGRLETHQRSRPCSPYRTYKTRENRKAA